MDAEYSDIKYLGIIDNIPTVACRIIKPIDRIEITIMLDSNLHIDDVKKHII